MPPIDPWRYVGEVCRVAAAAGACILEVYARGFSVTRKHDDSPLTEADSAAHEKILARLSGLTPTVPVLSEESTGVDYATRAAWKEFWLVDPLDGTREFISRNGEFTVNIALIVQGQPALGVVYVPVRAETYFACRGHGAYRQESGKQPEPIRARRFDGGRPVVMASRSHAGKRTLAVLQALGECEVVRMGSSLKLCLIAAGVADICLRFGTTMEWDIAAAQCIVEEAGGRVVDANGRPLTYNKSDLRNPRFVVSGPGDHDWTQYLSIA